MTMTTANTFSAWGTLSLGQHRDEPTTWRTLCTPYRWHSSTHPQLSQPEWGATSSLPTFMQIPASGNRKVDLKASYTIVLPVSDYASLWANFTTGPNKTLESHLRRSSWSASKQAVSEQNQHAYWALWENQRGGIHMVPQDAQDVPPLALLPLVLCSNVLAQNSQATSCCLHHCMLRWYREKKCNKLVENATQNKKGRCW